MRAGSRTVATGTAAADVGEGGNARLGGLGGGNSEDGRPGGGVAEYGGTGVAGGARTGGRKLRTSSWNRFVAWSAYQAKNPAPATAKPSSRSSVRRGVASPPMPSKYSEST